MLDDGGGSSGNGSPCGLKARLTSQPPHDEDSISKLLASAASVPPELWLPSLRQPPPAAAAGQRPTLPKQCLYLAVMAVVLANVAWLWQGSSPTVLLRHVGSTTPVALQVESLQQDGTVAEEVYWGRQKGSSTKHAPHVQQQAGLNLDALEAIGRASSLLHTANTGPNRDGGPSASPAETNGLEATASNAAAAVAASPILGVPSATEQPASSSASLVLGPPSPAAELVVGLGASPEAHSKQESSPHIESSKPTVATATSVAAAAERISASRKMAARTAHREHEKGRPLTALVLPPDTLPASPHNCSQALQCPRVALLFLTRGHLFHEPTWRLWFQSAAGLLPAGVVQGSACTPDADLEALHSACTTLEGAGILDRQHLFSVYIHAPPTFDLPGRPNLTDYPGGSLWRGRIISHRLYPHWGGFSLVEATRSLLWEAYRDPLNQRFLLISESGVPLYDPLTMYSQLLSESKSRVVGCSRGGSDHPQRWSWHMQIPGLMRRSHWRKSSQWFVLLRDHARIILKDELVFRKFEEWCWGGWDSDYNRWRDCYSDEHYIPTLLGGVHGRSGEMQCTGARGVSAADWTSGGPHPKSFKPWHATPSLITRARSYATKCNGTLAQDRAQLQFVNASEALDPATRDTTCAALERIPPHYDSPLSESCYLTVRKFPEDTAAAIYALFTDCNSGLRLLSDEVCGAAQPLQQ